jgi:hypothetical protein
MNTTLRFRQRGLSFSGFIFGAIALVIVSIFGLKLIPPYMQNAQLKNLLVVLANDPELQQATPREIRMAFSRRAEVDNITVVKADEIEISKETGRLVLSANYDVFIPMASNVSLYLEFTPSSDQ